MEEAATPFPSEETTPPVTKIYFGAIHAARVRNSPSTPGLSALHRSDVHTIIIGMRAAVKSKNQFEELAILNWGTGRCVEAQISRRIHECRETFLHQAGFHSG